MVKVQFHSAGESHGKGLVALIKGFPAGLVLDIERINRDLAMRQRGYGRGGRMKIETDRIEFLSGVRGRETIGSPITLFVKNADFANWEPTMTAEGEMDAKMTEQRARYIPRPGHSDFAGLVKWGRRDMRDILERASARSTTVRVAAGSIMSQFLERFGIHGLGYVREIGGIELEDPGELPVIDIKEKIETSDLRGIGDEDRVRELVDRTRSEGDTLGGVVEVRVDNLPVGLGSCADWDTRLDAALAGAVMSVQAIKAVEIGDGVRNARLRGSQVHDEFGISQGRVTRLANRAGGIEAGMSNGQPLIVRAYMKPISTLIKGLRSVDIRTRREVMSKYERSDICAVPACSKIVEAVVMWQVGAFFLDKFGGDCIVDVERNFEVYRERAERIIGK